MNLSLSLSLFPFLFLSRTESRPPGGRQLSRRRQSAFRGDVACTAERHTASSPILSALFSLFLSIFLLSISASLLSTIFRLSASVPSPVSFSLSLPLQRVSLSAPLVAAASVLAPGSISFSIYRIDAPCRTSTWLATRLSAPLRSGYTAASSTRRRRRRLRDRRQRRRRRRAVYTHVRPYA